MILIHQVYNMQKTKARTKKNNHLQKTNVIYQYSCPEGGCRLLNRDKYIGATTTSLSRRLTMHLREGAIKKHAKEEHGQDITRKTLTENTDVIHSCNDHRRIWITEALYIREYSPHLNKQCQSTTTLSLWNYL